MICRCVDIKGRAYTARNTALNTTLHSTDTRNDEHTLVFSICMQFNKVNYLFGTAVIFNKFDYKYICVVI